LIFAINLLRECDLLFTGANISFEDFMEFPNVKTQFKHFYKTYNLILRESGLIKIIKPEHTDDFIKQLSDYTYRPSLRKPRTPDELCTHKYVHATDEIIPYESHKQKDKVKEYISLKKQSFAFLSKDLNTHVYGTSDAIRPLVGLIFDQKKCLPPKAIFKHDYGTVGRKWVGTEDEVKSYAARVRQVRLSNWNELCEHVRDNKDAEMTEILAKVTREGATSIVIARNTKESRSLALELETKLRAINIKIPIIFFNRTTQKISLYSEKSLLKSAQARSELLKMQESASNQAKDIGLFAAKDSAIRLQNITDLVNSAAKLETQNSHIWQDKLLEAQNLPTNSSSQVLPNPIAGRLG
jgi:hypothetical protein